MVTCSAIGCPNRTDKGESQDSPKTSFHRFPKNLELRNQWIKAVRRKDWLPREKSALCSVHFTEDCFNRTLNITRLRCEAVPTIFAADPSYLQQCLQKQRRPLERKLPRIAEPPRMVLKTEVPSLLVDLQAPTSTSAEPLQKVLKTEALALFVDPMNVLTTSLVDTQPSTSRSENTTPPINIQKEMISRSTSISPEPKHRSESPRIVQMRQLFKSRFAEYRKKIKLLQQVKRRQKNKTDKMKNILKSLRAMNSLLEKNIEILSNISGPNKQILKTQILKNQRRIPKT